MQESIVFLVRVQCRRKESSRSLSHLLMSFLLTLLLTPGSLLPGGKNHNINNNNTDDDVMTYYAAVFVCVRWRHTLLLLTPKFAIASRLWKQERSNCNLCRMVPVRGRLLFSVT